MTPCPNCQWPHHAAIAISVQCAKCGTIVHINGGDGVERKRTRLPERNRHDPKLIKWIKWLRRPDEKGVGDTVERLLSIVGGRKIKQQLEQLGVNCGCKKRQDWLNQRYPYTTHGGDIDGVSKIGSGTKSG